ncbi:hypothetical protein NL676_008179 [Syzygium grande]|nr:hypothetical protein NL676_008179 [Syzygium grande]
MGHLMPVLRLATMLAKRNCVVTVITAHPTVSAAESDQISFPSPPSSVIFVISAFFSYVCGLLSSCQDSSIAKELHLPVYVVATTSVECISLMAYFPVLTSNPTEFNNASTEIKIPGLPPMAMSSLPPALLNPGNLFTSMTIMNSQALSKADGILTNTFEYFQASTLGAVNKARVTASLPPILPVGPLEPYRIPQDGDHRYRSWLENQPSQSVVYISFGSRTAISRDQVQELESGLRRPGGDSAGT